VKWKYFDAADAEGDLPETYGMSAAKRRCATRFVPSRGKAVVNIRMIGVHPALLEQNLPTNVVETTRATVDEGRLFLRVARADLATLRAVLRQAAADVERAKVELARAQAELKDLRSRAIVDLERTEPIAQPASKQRLGC
jgi:multidrug efflux pump subunit AcrA (membrane-fusion protein)